MNGYPTGRAPYDYGAPNLPSQNSNPTDKPEGYAQDGNANGFAQDAPRYQVRRRDGTQQLSLPNDLAGETLVRGILC